MSDIDYFSRHFLPVNQVYRHFSIILYVCVSVSLVYICFIFVISYFRVTIFWSPKTRTLGPANTWANSNDTRSLLKATLLISTHLKLGYASSVWKENCYILIWNQEMSWENRTVGHPKLCPPHWIKWKFVSA